MSEQEKINACYKKMYQGMIEKDCALLESVLDEKFVLVHMTGMRQSKEVFIRAVKNGTLNYFSALHESIESEVCGRTAVSVGKSVVNAAVFGGGQHTWQLKIKMQLVKEKNDWRIAEALVSTY